MRRSGPAATATDFTADAEVWQWEDDLMGVASAQGQTGIGIALQTSQPASSYVYGVATQGPFVLYSASAVDQGFNVLWLDANGLIRYSWDIRAQPGSTAPTASGG